jgi:preprotein translocase subunit SecF
MNIFKHETNIRFIDKKNYAFALSALIILLGVLTFFQRGFNLGIDFTGGTLMEVSFTKDTTVRQVRALLQKGDLGDAGITRIGNENKFFIRTMSVSGKSMSAETMEDYNAIARTIKSLLMSGSELASEAAGRIDLNNNSEGEIARFLRDKSLSDEDAAETARIITEIRKGPSGLIKEFSVLENSGIKKRILAQLRDWSFLGGFSVLSVEIVGPQVGKDLRNKATLACIWSLIGMLVYIAFRFKLLYGLSGILTLFHDVLVALSFILFFRIEVNLTVIAAILTLVGYSINDTIVIFDRLRDNLKIMRKDNLQVILDKSINQTLSRTIITSLTVFLTILALFFFGGEVIHPFAFTMLVGVITGTYSSIYQSCAWLKVWEKRLLKSKKI